MTAGKLRSTGPLALLALLTLLGAGLRFYGLGRESLWNDELHTRWLSSEATVRQVVAHTLADDGQPPTHHLLLHYVQRFWGDSEAALRFPSALAGVLSIPAIFLLGRLLYGTFEGLLAAGFLTVLWCPIYYSQEARPYALLLFAVLVASCFWVALLRRWDQGETSLGLEIGYVISALGCCYLHHFGVGLVFLQGFLAFLLVRRRWTVLATWAAVAVGYLPGLLYLLRQRRHSGSWAWIEPPGLHSVTEYVKFLFNYSETLAIFAVGMGLLGIYWGRRPSVPPERRIGPLSPSALLALWLVLPFLGAVAVSYLSFPLLTNRNLIVGLPAAYLLLARGIAVRPADWRRTSLAVLLVLVLLGHLLFDMRYYSVPRKEQFREAVAEVVAHDPDSTGSLVVGRAYHREYFDYYFVRLGSRRRVDLVAGTDADIPALRALLDSRHPDRVWLLAGHLPVEEGCLSFLRGRYEERQHRSLVGAGAWLFTRPGAGLPMGQ